MSFAKSCKRFTWYFFLFLICEHLLRVIENDRNPEQRQKIEKITRQQSICQEIMRTKLKLVTTLTV
jgi:hypothetical protein